MDDLSQRDLSSIPDADLTTEERKELERRFDEFMTRVHEKAGRGAAVQEKPKHIMRWNPATAGTRH